MKIGPRLCTLTDNSGAEEKLEIKISSSETAGSVSQDPMAYEGWAHLSRSSGMIEFHVYATDEILLVGRLIALVGSYLLGECDRTGKVLSTADRSSILKPFDLF